MKILLIILFFIPMFCFGQTISQRVTNLEIANINTQKQIKALVKSDSLAAARELVANSAFNVFQLDFGAFKQYYTAEIKIIKDSLSKIKTYYFDTSYSFRFSNDTIFIKKPQ